MTQTATDHADFAVRHRHRPVALVLALIVVLGFAAPAVIAPSAMADGTSIANIARGELGPNGSPGNAESPTNSGCNKYTGALYGHSGSCPGN